MMRSIVDEHQLADLVRLADLSACDVVEYDLPTYKSILAMELLQVATRKQARVFRVDDDIVRANVDTNHKQLRIDVDRLNHVNETIQRRIERDTSCQVSLLRDFHFTCERIHAFSTEFENQLAAERIEAEDVIAYFDMITSVQELGVLKFCFSETLLRATLNSVLAERDDVLEELLQPHTESVLVRVQRRRHELAVRKVTSEPARYQDALRRHCEDFGFLEAEDFDYDQRSATDYQDGLVDQLLARHGQEAASLRARLEKLETAVADRHAAWCRAMDFFLSQLVHMKQEATTCYNQLALRESLMRHEEWNRYSKMRFLRNLDQVLRRVGLPRFTSSVLDVVGAVS